MNAWKQAGLILSLAAVAGVASAVFHPLRPPWYEVSSAAEMRWGISLDEAREIIVAGDVVWIDARSRANYEADHLPGAILLNPEEWGELVFNSQESLQAAFTRPVIVYCDGDACTRSGEVSELLREQMGLDPVYILQGEWRELRSAVTAE
jgi:rhodanese-related sulfurtransferase